MKLERMGGRVAGEKNFKKLSDSRGKVLEGKEMDAFERLRREFNDHSFRGLETELDIRLLK